MRRWGGCCWLGICALGLGLGILIAAVFPVGCLMFLVSFLLIACGIACLRDRRGRHEDHRLAGAPWDAGTAAPTVRRGGITVGVHT